MRKQRKNEEKVLVFGRGQMAGFVARYFSNPVISGADVTKKSEIEKDIQKYKPSVVINTAAKTSIDWCELNKLEAFDVNVLGPDNIWALCRKNGIFFCHFSSGCIYHSATYDQIYDEDDKPNPRCYYSWTKVWADNLLGRSPNLLILRPRVVISSQVSRRNTLAKWLVYSHFIKDQNSVSVVEDMFPILVDMVGRRISGVFNIVNRGTISPLEIAYILKEEINPKMRINETTLDEVNKNLVAKRCSTVLSTSKLLALGYEMPRADESIKIIVKKFKKNLLKAGGLGALEEVRRDTRQKYSAVTSKATTYTEEN